MTNLLRTKTATALVAALLLVLAGCAGGVGPAADGGTAADATDTDVTDDDATDDDTADSALAPSTGETSGDVGTVTMYVSDSPIEDFEHLNVSVSKVGLKRAAGENGSDGEWVEYEVDNRTVDLTELQGPNATSLGVLSAPAGNYTKVFVYVDEVEGILKTGEEVNVKLPSQKLQLNSAFTVAPNSSVDFVFDISVFEAGNSGKHILKPVVGESGTGDDVEIRDVDEEEEGDDDERDEGDENETETEDEAEDDETDDEDEAEAEEDETETAEDETDEQTTDDGQGEASLIAVPTLRTPV